MYDLSHFKEKDFEVIREFMQQHPFVLLCGANAAAQPVATQVPILMEEREGRLYFCGHFMKQTDHHRAFEENPDVLVIFTGPHTYVSASWYSNPLQASTWNYMAVHVRGKLRLLEEAALLEILQKTTARFEGAMPNPSLFEKLPGAYVEKLVKAIIAFEIDVTEIAHVFKLSQNRDKESFAHIIRELEGQDADAKSIASEMNRRKAQLFNSSGESSRP